MHELSLLAGVVDTATEVAAGRPILAVNLTVGLMSGAVPDILENCWPIAVVDTACADAVLNLTIQPATVWCPSCGQEQRIDEYFALTCPVCSTPTADLRHGREFQLTSIDVE